MTDVNNKLKKSFESINKNLYRTKKVLDLYNPLQEILKEVTDNFQEISKTVELQKHLEKDVEEEIKQRELISLFKKMKSVVFDIKEDMNVFYKELENANKFLENYRSYRNYTFKDTTKSHEFVKKIIDSFNIKEFILRFNVVGTIDLNEVAKKVNGKRQGIDIIVSSENLSLIYSEILKSKSIKFRLVCEFINIYYESGINLYIEGPSKKIRLCDIEASNFDAKILDI